MPGDIGIRNDLEKNQKTCVAPDRDSERPKTMPQSSGVTSLQAEEIGQYFSKILDSLIPAADNFGEVKKYRIKEVDIELQAAACRNKDKEIILVSTRDAILADSSHYSVKISIRAAI